MGTTQKRSSLAASLCLMFIFTLTACNPTAPGTTTPASQSGTTAAVTTTAAAPSSQPAAGIKFTPGTYTATKMANNGPLTIAVTFTESAIEKIAVDKSTETLGLGTVAIENLSDLIIKNQSLDMDSISGATYTSGAFIAAVSDCVEQAKGDVEALQKVPLAQAPAGHEDLTVDLVVVGGGSSGMTAATRAAQEGLSVVILEKMAFTGGASMIAGGSMVIAGSQLQKEKGVTDDTPEIMVEDFLANGSNLNDQKLLNMYAQNVGPTIDWAMESLGLKFTGDLQFNAEYSKDRVIGLEGGAAGYGQILRQALDKSNAKLYLETRAEKLIVEDGKVIGVEAKSNNGSTYTIKAKKVLLATGGFGNNDDMLSDELKDVLYYGPMSSTGDGHTMAKAVDAKFQLMDYGKRYPNGVEVAKGIGKSTIYGNLAAFSKSGILVNKSGNRVVNERASNKAILTEQLKAEGQQLYLVMDGATYEAFSSNLAANSITREDLERWIANQGKTTPVLVKADTLEAAAALAGVDGAALKGTVDKYNGFVASGTDPDFGRKAEYMKSAIGNGPYYIVEQKPRFATTMGGVVVTENMQILNADDQPIENLYAAGELVNGVHGDDSAPGANLGWALTSGKLAADAIIDALK